MFELHILISNLSRQNPYFEQQNGRPQIVDGHYIKNICKFDYSFVVAWKKALASCRQPRLQDTCTSSPAANFTSPRGTI